MRMRLYDILKNESQNGRAPYHMPGHKRRAEYDYLGDAALIDYTEIDGLDNLHAPCGILREAMCYAAALYGAKKSFFLVNGSTGGVLSAVYSICRGGGMLIAARNSHKSVYNAAILCGSPVYYMMPRMSDCGFALDVTPAEAEEALAAHPNAAAMLVTSPTYDGVVSDIAGIAGVCHKRGVPLIVDAAHGAHLGFLDKTVKSPVACGADIAIMSLHKTLPSLTQTGILHVCGDLVDSDTIAQSLAVFETTSPSYVFMASVDGCLHEMANRRLFTDWKEKIAKIHEIAAACDGVHLFIPEAVFAYDESKLILMCDGYTGGEIADILRRRFRIEPEMTAAGYVLLMTGAGDTWEMTDSLCGVFEFFAQNPRRAEENTLKSNPYQIAPDCRMKLSDAVLAKSEAIPIGDAAGRISAEFVMPYPPGIPLIAPGEGITTERIQTIEALLECGLNLLTSHGEFGGTIPVVC